MQQNPCTSHVSQFELSKITLKNLNKFKISPSAKLVLLSLVDCYNPKNNEIYPKQKTLANALGISERSVVRAIKELYDAKVLIYELKSQNRYRLTKSFFDEVNLSVDIGQNVGVACDKLSLSCHEQKHEHKKNKVLTFQNNLGEKYAEVFEKLSEYDFGVYKGLKGYEKEEWLKAKKKDFALSQNSAHLQANIEIQKRNTGSPLDLSKDEAVRFLNNLMPELKNSFFAREIRKKWGL